MATTVYKLSTKSLGADPVSSGANEYLYCTNINSRVDTKLPLTSLFTYAKSVGSGLSLLTSVSKVNHIELKTINSLSTTISIKDNRTRLDFSFVEGNLNLSKCSNTTSLFLSTVNLASNVGATVLPTANGGTNKSTAYVVGDVLYASATDTLAGLADIATGNALISGGVGVAPSWGKVGLTTHVSGILPVVTGGTGVTTFTSNGALYGNGAGVIGSTPAGANGQLLIGATSGAPAFATVTSSDSTITFATGASTLALSTRISILKSSGGTAALAVDGSNNLVSQGNATLTFKRAIENVTASTLLPAVSDSGKIYTLNRAGGVQVTLPAAAAGLTYEFHVGTTMSGTFGIDAASSADTLQGAIYMGTGGLGNDSDDNAENHGYSSPISGVGGDHQYVADADTKGRFIGTRLKYTAITDAVWLVEGFAITSGAIATPWT